MSNVNRYEILASDRYEVLASDLADKRDTEKKKRYTLLTKTTSEGKKVTVRLLHGCPCGNSCKSYADEKKSVREGIVKKYQQQVKESRGFDIKDYPGFIPDVTNIVPCQEVIDNREQNPKDYENIMDMAALAIKGYNEKYQGRKFKVAEIEKLNVEGCLAEKTYYITFRAVGVKREKESLKSDFFNELLTTSQIIMTTFLYWLCLLSLLPWKQSLGAKLTKLKIPHNLKASEQELGDKTAVLKTFRAKVQDHIDMKREVLFCSEKHR